LKFRIFDFAERRPGEKLPLIVNPHGRDRNHATDGGYNSYAQFLGKSRLCGSATEFSWFDRYGKQFVDAGNLQWGEKMQDDLTWGVKHLVAQGHCR
jgi:dipeptidyl aminopeptidase/acylaminoacyl peptidase